jgi:excinuclease ABC subunit C
VLELPRPPERIDGFDISNISGTFKVASMVAFHNGRPDRSNYRRFRIKSVEGQDDFASIAEVVRRRYSRVLREGRSGQGPPRLETSGHAQPGPGSPADATEGGPGEIPSAPPPDPAPGSVATNPVPVGPATEAAAGLPDLILIDGGKGQLAAAQGELAELGLSHVPIIGLAKEFEEIHRPGHEEPLRLSRDNGALKLLQRVRDESHRLANTYNAQLRLRIVSESILDEFPSIGQRRKAALLKKFGSIQRLRAASIEEIAQVPGFGGKAAAELRAFLEARQ